MENIEIENDGFQIKFKGDLNGIDAHTFIKVIDSYVNILDKIHSEEGNGELKLKIQKAGEGCFWIDIGAAIITAAQTDLVSSISTTKDLIEFFSSYLSIFKIGKGKKIEKQNVQELEGTDNVQINGNGNNITVNKNIYNFYDKDSFTRQQAQKGFSAVSSNESISELQLNDLGTPEGPLFSCTHNEMLKFSGEDDTETLEIKEGLQVERTQNTK